MIGFLAKTPGVQGPALLGRRAAYLTETSEKWRSVHCCFPQKTLIALGLHTYPLFEIDGQHTVLFCLLRLLPVSLPKYKLVFPTVHTRSFATPTFSNIA